MKIWKVSFHTAHDGMLIAWRGSHREAQKRRQQFLQAHGPAMGPDTIEAVDIPTDRAGLIDWLNANLNTDNG